MQIIFEGCVKHSFLQDTIPSLYLGQYLDVFGALYLELSDPLRMGREKGSETGQV